MKKIILSMAAVIALFFNIGFAANTSAVANPVAMLDTTAQSMIQVLKQNRDTIKQHPDQLYGLVKNTLLPRVDLSNMSQQVLGRRVWSLMSTKEREKFSIEFSKLVVNTYSSALNSYNDEVIKFYPVRGSYQDSAMLVVKSDIIQRGGRAIGVTYRMHRVANTWKVIDFSVEGVSMVSSFRSQFASQISSGTDSQVRESLQAMLENLVKHNQQNV